MLEGLPPVAAAEKMADVEETDADGLGRVLSSLAPELLDWIEESLTILGSLGATAEEQLCEAIRHASIDLQQTLLTRNLSIAFAPGSSQALVPSRYLDSLLENCTDDVLVKSLQSLPTSARMEAVKGVPPSRKAEISRLLRQAAKGKGKASTTTTAQTSTAVRSRTPLSLPGLPQPPLERPPPVEHRPSSTSDPTPPPIAIRSGESSLRPPITSQSLTTNTTPSLPSHQNPEGPDLPEQRGGPNAPGARTTSSPSPQPSPLGSQEPPTVPKHPGPIFVTKAEGERILQQRREGTRGGAPSKPTLVVKSSRTMLPVSRPSSPTPPSPVLSTSYSSVAPTKPLMPASTPSSSTVPVLPVPPVTSTPPPLPAVTPKVVVLPPPPVPGSSNPKTSTTGNSSAGKRIVGPGVSSYEPRKNRDSDDEDPPPPTIRSPPKHAFTIDIPPSPHITRLPPRNRPKAVRPGSALREVVAPDQLPAKGNGSARGASTGNVDHTIPLKNTAVVASVKEKSKSKQSKKGVEKPVDVEEQPTDSAPGAGPNDEEMEYINTDPQELGMGIKKKTKAKNKGPSIKGKERQVEVEAELVVGAPGADSNGEEMEYIDTESTNVGAEGPPPPVHAPGIPYPDSDLVIDLNKNAKVLADWLALPSKQLIKDVATNKLATCPFLHPWQLTCRGGKCSHPVMQGSNGVLTQLFSQRQRSWTARRR